MKAYGHCNNEVLLLVAKHPDESIRQTNESLQNTPTTQEDSQDFKKLLKPCSIYIDKQSTRNQYRLRWMKSNGKETAMYIKDEDEAKRVKRFIIKSIKSDCDGQP